MMTALGDVPSLWHIELESHGIALNASILADMCQFDNNVPNSRPHLSGRSRREASARLVWRPTEGFPDSELTGAVMVLTFAGPARRGRAWVCVHEAEAEALATWGPDLEPGLTQVGVVGAWSEACLRR